MATLNEIAYNIRNLYREGRSSNNDILSLEQIKFIVKSYRALYLRREVNKNGAILDTFNQTMCFELELVDKSKCPELEMGCKTLRSKEKIPKLMRGRVSLLVSFVGAVDGTTRFQLVPPFTVNWQQYNKISSKNIKAFIFDDYIYVFPDCRVKYAMIRGVFEDPEDLKGSDNENGICYDDSSEFPLPVDMIPNLIQDILKNELRVLELGEEDTTNDTIQN